jgi:hypothetical protein
MNITALLSITSEAMLGHPRWKEELSDITGPQPLLTVLSLFTVPGTPQLLQNSLVWNFAMTSPTETALTLVVVKSLAIVGSAFAAVLFLAVVGTKRG